MVDAHDELAARRRRHERERYEHFCSAIRGVDPTAARSYRYSDDQLRSLFRGLLAGSSIETLTCRFHGLPEWRSKNPADDPMIIARARGDAESGEFRGDINDQAVLIEWCRTVHCCEDLSDFGRPYDNHEQAEEYDHMIAAINSALDLQKKTPSHDVPYSRKLLELAVQKFEVEYPGYQYEVSYRMCLEEPPQRVEIYYHPHPQPRLPEGASLRQPFVTYLVTERKRNVGIALVPAEHFMLEAVDSGA